MLDPFLLLDEFCSDNPDDYIAGFPPHPHRGFETITYMMNGRFHHQDSAGNEGSLKDGSVQWMTAGRGVIHSEMPEQTEGLVRGFQLWLNLPKKEKMIDPAYQDIHTEMIPVIHDQNGSFKIIAGTYEGTTGPGKSPGLGGYVLIFPDPRRFPSTGIQMSKIWKNSKTGVSASFKKPDNRF